MHGKTSRIYHDNYGIFRGICSPFTAARYHSLTVMFSRTELVVTSYTRDGVIMGMSHPELPLHGVQFHPESFLTEHGFILVENFLRLGPLEFVGFDSKTQYFDCETRHAPFNVS
ncbi:MAG: gamma-glutamyl-gamma-aminobutyrate hydrolase family protein [Desulfobacterales bacterium]